VFLADIQPALVALKRGATTVNGALESILALSHETD
jgi:hypothetical protein